MQNYSTKNNGSTIPVLELGASRVLQWGGEGRSESLNTLWQAIKGNDNVYNPAEDPSNQLAGIDFRLNLNKAFRVSNWCLWTSNWRR